MIIYTAAKENILINYSNCNKVPKSIHTLVQNIGNHKGGSSIEVSQFYKGGLSYSMKRHGDKNYNLAARRRSPCPFD